MSDNGLNHVLRELSRAIIDLSARASTISQQLGRLINQGEAQAETLTSIADTLVAIEDIVANPEPIGAVTGRLLFYKHGELVAMDTFNPTQLVDFVAEFDKADGTVGRIDGPAHVEDDNANDVVTVTDDGSSTGTCTGSIDGKANDGGLTPKPVSNIKVTGDGNLRGDVVAPVVLEGAITWDNASDIGSTGGKVTFTARAATPAEVSKFRAAVAKRQA